MHMGYQLKLCFNIEVRAGELGKCFLFFLNPFVVTKGQFAGFAFNNGACTNVERDTNRSQVVGVNEGQIALALLKGQKEMSLGMGHTRWPPTSYK